MHEFGGGEHAVAGSVATGHVLALHIGALTPQTPSLHVAV
jgi:hypothetical protein